MLVQQVARTYGDRVKVVNEDFGASPLAERYGITQYPAVFVGEALIARPRDFYLWGSTEQGRYTPFTEPDNRRRFQEDLRRMLDTVLGGGTAETVELTDADRRGLAALPEFAARDLAGAELTSASLAGKVVVVEFWATWCPPCQGTLAWLDELSRRHPEDIAVIAPALDSEDSAVRAVAASLEGRVRFVPPAAGIVERFGHVAAIPTLFVFDRQGRTAGVFYGAPDGLHAEVDALIGRLVSGGANRAQADARARIREELTRLRGAVDPQTLPEAARAGVTPLLASLDTIEALVERGDILLALRTLESSWVQLAALAYRTDRTAVAGGDVDAWKTAWKDAGPGFHDQVARYDRAPRAALPVAVAALAEVQRNKAPRYYDSALLYGQADTVESGLYYLGAAEGGLDFALFCIGLDLDAPAEAPRAPGLAAAFEALNAEVVAGFADPPAGQDRQYAALNATLKETGELLAAGRDAGALYKYLEARMRRAMLRQDADLPGAADLGQRIEAWAGRLDVSNADHSIATVFLADARERLRAEAPDEAARRAAAAIVSDVLPAYVDLIGAD